MSVTFSDSLVKEYQKEMYETYGVFVCEEDAQVQLRSLTRSMFSTDIAVRNAESREQGARKGDLSPACTGSLSGTMADDGRNEVGASITPTSGHRDKENYG